MSNETKFTKGDWELEFYNGRVATWCGEECIVPEITIDYPFRVIMIVKVSRQIAGLGWLAYLMRM